MGPKSAYSTPPLTSLPPELLIHILSYLDVQSLVSIQLVSKTFDALLKDHLNESVIWRNACITHRLIGFAEQSETSTSDSSLTASNEANQSRAGGSVGSEPPRREWGRWREWVEKQSRLGGSKGEATDVVWSDVLDLYSSQSLKGLSTDVNWKAFFKRRLEIHRSFVGQLPSDIICYKDSDSSSTNPYRNDNDDDSYLAKLRRIYEALMRIHDERKKLPSSAVPRLTIRYPFIFGADGDDDNDEETEFYLDSGASAEPQKAGHSDSDADSTEGIAAPSIPALTDSLLSRYLYTLGRIVPTNEKVHRIKVDEKNGFFLTTSRAGGLVVRDVESKRVLWELPKSYVRIYSHLEYENGYIIFDRTNGSQEVWRSSSIPAPRSPSARVLQPDERQHLASALAAPSFPSPSSDDDDDKDARIRGELRSEAMSTSYPPTRQRLLDMASTQTSSSGGTTKKEKSSLLPIEAIVRCALRLSGETAMVDAGVGIPGLDFDVLESVWKGEGNVWDEDPVKRRQDSGAAASGSVDMDEGGTSSVCSGNVFEKDGGEETRGEAGKKATPHRLSPYFVPHFVIPVPQIQVTTQGHQPVTQTVEDPTRAYRFVYPYLLAASPHRAGVWDVRTGEQVQVEENIQNIAIPEGYGRDSEFDLLGSEGERGGRGGGSTAGQSVAETPHPQGVMAVFGLSASSSGISTFVQGNENSDDDRIDEEHHMLGVNVHPPPYSGPQPGGVAPSSSKSKGKETVMFEEREEDQGDQEDEEEDPIFPTFKPFKSGWWDANSTFSGNGFSSSSSRGTHPSSSSTSTPTIATNADSTSKSEVENDGRRKRGDPLALISNIFTQLGNINYVELGERWIFLCGHECVRVFAREKEFFEDDSPSTTKTGSTTARTTLSTSSNTDNRGGNGTPRPQPPANSHWTPEDFTSLTPGSLVLRIPSDKIQYSRWSAALGSQSYRPHWGSEVIRQEVVWDDEMARQSEESVNVGVVDSPGLSRMRQRNRGRFQPRRGGFVHGAGGNQAGHEEEDQEREANGLGRMIKRRKRMYDEFIAVHISPCQNHLALLLSSSRLIFIPHFERLIRAEEDLWDVGVDVQLGSVRCPSVHLSYGGGEARGGGSAGRVGVVTQQGIYVITPSLKQQSLSNSTSSSSARPVELIVMRLAPSFMDPSRLIDVSCLQISDTGVWVNYDAPEPPKIETEGEVQAKGREKLEKGKGRYQRKMTSGSGGQSGSGVVPSYGEEDEDDEMFGEHDDENEMGDEDQWEDVNSDEDDEEDETDDEALEPNPYGDDEASEPSPYHRLEPGQTVPLVSASRSAWVIDPRYPMVAIKSRTHAAVEAAAVSSSSAALNPSTGTSTSRTVVDKGKWTARADHPASKSNSRKSPLSYHTPGKARRWVNQQFPMDATPPSQFQVRGGKCKWNHAEVSSTGRKLEVSMEREAILHDSQFTMTLSEKRIIMQIYVG
ncbi:hypothetical protein EST38_g7509 [Candolleomyces aberdarensis]|uniref:F-box domain-containing protein n=1 Tax=Candolleomyces aberdarensis TaxID=2316362 RepID=A0A4Q2DF29_9AGAR|nr:hypothetical protein EST38_g7509 [Candolleomyces aberdarensis]